MELLTLEEAVEILNISVFLFISFTVWQVYQYRQNMIDSAYHHLRSHAYMALWAVVSVNMFYHKGWVFTIVFTSLYTLAHVLKENIRLAKTNHWKPSVKDY